MTLRRQAWALVLVLIAAPVVTSTTAAPAPAASRSLGKEIVASLKRVKHDITRISGRDLSAKKKHVR